MTQIVTTSAALGGMTLGKGPGMKPGAGDNFAAMVVGLGLTTGEPGTTEPEGFALAGEAGTDAGVGTDAETTEGKSGEPVILDLALDAAAQSAMADMVVALPVPIIVPPSHGSGAHAPSPGLSAAVNIETDGAAPVRGGAQRPMAGMAPKFASASETVSISATTPVMEAAQSEHRDQAASSPIPMAILAGTPSTPIVQTLNRTGQIASSLPGNSDTASAMALDKEVLPATAAQVGGQIVMPGRRVVTSGDVSASVMLPTASTIAPERGQSLSASLPAVPPQGTEQVPSDSPILPADIRQASVAAQSPSIKQDVPNRPINLAPQSRQAGEALSTSAAMADGDPIVVASPDVTAILATDSGRSCLAEPTAVRPLAIDPALRQGLPPVPVHARAVNAALPSVESVTNVPAQGDAHAEATSEQALYSVQPIMSALHRASAAPVEGRNGDAVPTGFVAGESARKDTGNSSGKNSDRDSGGAALGGDSAVQGSTSLVDTLPGGRQFADIIQGLPPIAQSRIGMIGDSASVVAGAVDVGATLQGQAIDMTVGGQWIDRVAAEITALAQGNGHSRFQLSPPNLGRIQIDIWQGDGGGRVQLLTETDEAARQLRDGQSSLQADPRLAALQLGSIVIDKAATGFDTSRDQGNAQNSQQNGQQNNHRQQQSGNEQGSQTSQTGAQANQQNGSQQNGQAGLQAGMQGGNSGEQSKSSPRRDVLNHQADIVNQQGGTTGRDGDRLVRYA